MRQAGKAGSIFACIHYDRSRLSIPCCSAEGLRDERGGQNVPQMQIMTHLMISCRPQVRRRDLRASPQQESKDLTNVTVYSYPASRCRRPTGIGGFDRPLTQPPSTGQLSSCRVSMTAEDNTISRSVIYSGLPEER
jgi:hypothetical protein